MRLAPRGRHRLRGGGRRAAAAAGRRRRLARPRAAAAPGDPRALLRDFVNKEVRPRTRALCGEATEGRSHRAACLEFAEMLSKWRVVGFIAGFVGFCEPSACWHSCDGASAEDADGYHGAL